MGHFDLGASESTTIQYEGKYSLSLECYYFLQVYQIKNCVDTHTQNMCCKKKLPLSDRLDYFLPYHFPDIIQAMSLCSAIILFVQCDRNDGQTKTSKFSYPLNQCYFMFYTLTHIFHVCYSHIQSNLINHGTWKSHISSTSDDPSHPCINYPRIENDEEKSGQQLILRVSLFPS